MLEGLGAHLDPADRVVGEQAAARARDDLGPALFDDFAAEGRAMSPAQGVVVDLGGLCLLYTSDAADDGESVDLGGRRIIKKIFFSSRRRHTRLPLVSWARRCV